MNTQTVAIVGGGFSGALIAKLLVQVGYKVILFERQAQLFLGATNRNWYRQHMGPHYPMDFETSKGVMNASVSSAQFLNPFFYKGVANPEYYIPSDVAIQQKFDGGTLTAERFLEVLEQQKAHYAHLLEQYPEAEAVFGTPDNFYCVLDPQVGNHMRHTEIGIRSNEKLIDIPLLVNSMTAAIESKVEIHTSTEVVNVCAHHGGFSLLVRNNQSGQTGLVYADQVVQAGWAKGIALDYQLAQNLLLGVNCKPPTPQELFGEEVLHRLRLSVVVKGHKVCPMATPHKMLLSPKSASYAYLSEKAGVLECTHLNVLDSAIGFRPVQWEQSRYDLFSSPEIDKNAQEVLVYCQKFLPFLCDAEVVGVVVGSVLSGIDLGKRSADALRNLNVIRSYGINGYHSVTGMKLSNIPLAAFTALKAVMEVTSTEHNHDWGIDLKITGEAFMKQLTRDTDFMLQPFYGCSLDRVPHIGDTMEGFAMQS